MKTGRKLVEMVGYRSGNLVVTERATPALNANGQAMWTVLCDCGATNVVTGSHLRQGRTKSCGCQTAELVGATHRKHGESHLTTEYVTWCSMRQRCADPASRSYPLYGGRGITVCDEWRDDYAAFLAHVGRRPSPRHSLDRIDNERGYEPGNVRWALPEVQARNTRSNRLITHDGQTFCLAEWSARTGIHRATIDVRLGLGWSPERALTTPVDMKHSRRRDRR